MVSSVQHNMGPTRFLSAACSVRNSNNSYHGRIKLDLHADTNVLGRNCVILTYTGKDCEVSPYSDEYNSTQHVPVVSRATSWNFSHFGETFVLIFNKASCMGEMLDHTLVNPNQILHHRINVQDNPCIQNPMVITFPEEDVTVPLYMSVTIDCADTSSTTQQQLYDCLRIVLTSPHDWYTRSIRFPKGLHSDR